MNLYFVVVALATLFGIVMFVIVMNFGLLWLRAMASGASVSFASLIGMKLRRVNANAIVNARIMGVKAGLKLDVDKLEAHYLAQGNVPRVVTAMIAANKASIPLTFERAAAIDLAGRDVLDAVQTSVNPKVIDCPDPAKGKRTIDGIAVNGIQVRARARVTVRSNIDRLVGGATEETIIARVGEGIVSAIGSADSHKQVLEHPDLISKKVLAKGLDAGTAFEILSIDIADVDVGDNIGARLQADQAEADMRVARAKAEERRAMAVAQEQEMMAAIKENRAKVVLAEAEVPKAMAEAFRSGNLGIMDYYRMKNLVSDTEMRTSIAGGSQVDSMSTTEPKT
ncbi:MAG: flotillin-like protein FloA [Deltaproteobacteria bacterium]|nr:flotillin-like protein FloA [Deltaproteobacteria bacterium]